jgi:cystathionine beta-lyase family protein involved in aluminum resistance
MTIPLENQVLSALQRIEAAESALARTVWPCLEAVYHRTFERVLNAFVRHRVGEEHFLSVTGYGHDDLGRETADAVFADALQAEAALVRPHIVSGTHALSLGLHGCLGPGQTMLSVTGRPYDTLEEVIGLRGRSRQSLMAKGVRYEEISIFHPSDRPDGFPVHALHHASGDPAEESVKLDGPGSGGTIGAFGERDADAIRRADLVFIQRSRGYSLRPTLTIAQLERLIARIKAIRPEAIVMVDNCYGEFTQEREPTAVGADLMAGSLIKNPGGGIMPTGGYLAGRADLVADCADALTCPGVGAEGGYMFDLTRLLLQGLYLAPGAVKEALKGMTLAARLFADAGYATAPHWEDARGDIIQILVLRQPERLVEFCRILQGRSPVNSHVVPIPANPPGYADEVVMAGGTFIDGSTLELSADGPLRPPYAVYLQGGLTYAHTRLVLRDILDAFLLDGSLSENLG